MSDEISAISPFAFETADDTSVSALHHSTCNRCYVIALSKNGKGISVVLIEGFDCSRLLNVFEYLCLHFIGNLANHLY